METPALIDQIRDRVTVVSETIIRSLQTVKPAIVGKAYSATFPTLWLSFSLVTEYYLSMFVIDVLDKRPVAQ